MYLRLSPYREVLQGVLTSLQVNEGIIKITGKSGSGKTALCSQLFHDIEEDGQSAVFFLKPPASANALQNDILDNLHLDPSGNFTRTLTAYLLAKASPQKPLVLIFDDAQQLDPQTFSAIRMLCNIQDQSRALIRVILCGSEELDQKLDGPALRAVTQFLNQSFTLPYLTQSQVGDFCTGYWLAENVDMKPLNERSLQKLFQETRGQPGILQARLNQGTTGAELVDRHDNAASAETTQAKPFKYAGPRKDWVPALLVITGLLVLAGVGGYFYFIPTIASDSVVSATNMPVAPREPLSLPEPEPQPEGPTLDPVTQPATPAVAADSQPAVEAIAEQAAESSAPDSAAVPEVDTIARNAPAPPAEPEPVAAAETPAVVAVAESTPDLSAAPQAAGSVRPSVEEFITAWTASWQSQDIDAYLAHYHPDFIPPEGVTQDAWREQRRRVISNATDIMISVEAPESTREAQNGMRLVRFWLHYSAANYADRTLKELLLVPVEGDWLIRTEASLRTERL